MCGCMCGCMGVVLVPALMSALVHACLGASVGAWLNCLGPFLEVDLIRKIVVYFGPEPKISLLNLVRKLVLCCVLKWT